MNKIILMIMVFALPFLGMSQKRSKKSSNDDKTDVKSSYKTNFMIIKGVEIDVSQEGLSQEEKESEDVSLDRIMKKHVKPMSKMAFSFDVGQHNSEIDELIDASLRFRSMAQAVNKAAEYGWSFVHSNVVVDGEVIIHYYYMKR